MRRTEPPIHVLRVMSIVVDEQSSHNLPNDP